MATKMVRQTMFTTGEVDVQNWKRTDVTEYLTSAQSLLNVEVGTTGLAKKRKGTTLAFNATGYAEGNSHMYEFVDKFGNYYLLISVSGFFNIFGAPGDLVNVIIDNGNQVVTNTGANVVAFADGLTFLGAVPTPYLTGDLDNIDYAQDNDSLLLTNPNFPPGRIYISAYHGSSTPTFSFQFLNIYPLPAYDFNTINYNNYTVVLSVSPSNVLTFEFTGVGATNPGFTSAWVGGQIIGGGATDIDPVGYAIITSVGFNPGIGGGTVIFTGIVQIPFQTTNYATQGSQYSVRQPAWSAALGYPAKVLFFQNRLWLANTQSLNNTVFGSKINAPINFDVGTGRDTDAIVYALGQTNSGSILWMNGGKQLEIYCQNYEFACPQDVNAALTPSSFSIRQQSSYGVSPTLKPITYINDSYYSIKTGKAIINFHFNGIGLTYQATNISAASSHLVKQPTNRALLRGSDTSQDNFIYFINPDNTVTSFQFATENKLAALTPIKFEENVDIIDIVTINNQVYFLKFYVLNNNYSVEIFDEVSRIDCQFEAAMQTSGLVTGLNLLNNYVVQVVYKNQDFGQYLVQNNQIIVNNPGGISDTVFIGLLYDVDITPMYIFAGSEQAPFFKQMTRIYVDYYNSLDFYINGNLIPYQNFEEIQAGLPLVPKTDTAIVNPYSGSSRFSTFSITQSSPFDLQILSIGYQISDSVI